MRPLLAFLFLAYASSTFNIYQNRINRFPAQEVNIFNERVAPDDRARHVWHDDFFQSEEIWVVRNKMNFFENLKSKGFRDEIIQLLENKFVKRLPEKLGVIFSFYEHAYSFLGGFIVLPQEVKDGIPAEVLREVYLDLFRTGYGPPSLSSEIKSEMETNIRSWSAPEKQKENFIERLFFIDGQYHLPVTQDIWPYIPVETKDMFIAAYTNPEKELIRHAIRVEIKIRSEQEIQEVARRYAGGRDPRAIERYLRVKLSESHTGEAIVPLENILRPFIRRKLNTYDLQGGPNCFNSGLCVNQGRSYSTEYTDAFALKVALENDYVVLDSESELRTGDLLLYIDANKEPAHLATYIDENIVFTKNGISKFNPYIFQRRAVMEQSYFPEGGFKLRVYRPKDQAYRNCSIPLKTTSSISP